MSKSTQIILVLLLVVILAAAVMRLSNLDWDDYNHYHPDERYITWVATSIEWPEDLQTALQPQLSTFNPFYWPAGAKSEGVVLEQDEPRRFAYGHLPLYMGVAFTRGLESIEPLTRSILPDTWLLTQDILNGAERNEFRHLTAAGRALTALIDVASIGLLFLLGRITYGNLAGLLAAAFLALNVMHIQLTHFFTVDPYLTFFVLLSLLFMALSIKPDSTVRRPTAYILLAAVAAGLAVGSKFGGTLLLVPLSATVFLQSRWSLSRRLATWLGATLIAFLAFAITNPFAIIDSTCQTTGPLSLGPIQLPDQLLRSCYLQNVAAQGSMVRGLRDVPFVRQYAGTVPFLYFIEMQVRWGMAPLLALVGYIGLVWAGWRVLLVAVRWWKDREVELPVILDRDPAHFGGARYRITKNEILLLSWSIPFFVTTGLLSVKFMRYMQPVVPLMMLYGAAMLLSLTNEFLRRTFVAIVLITTALYALAFINMYQQPHPWIAASRWIYSNVEEDALILNEMWDDQLPDPISVAGDLTNPKDYELKDVNWLSGTESDDDIKKLAKNLVLVAEADYLILASNRNYGVIPRLPERYPLSSQYYSLLFDEALGFEVAYVGTRTPGLLGIQLKPDSFSWPGLTPPNRVVDYLNGLTGPNLGRFDESFTVYDQPLVIILKNRDRKSAEEMATLFRNS